MPELHRGEHPFRQFRGILRGISLARRGDMMNPRAEALKARTLQYGVRVVKFSCQLARTWEGRKIADQLFRCGTSIGANYRAACRGRSHREFVAKLGVAVEESDETLYWLMVTQAAAICVDDDLKWLQREGGEIFAILSVSQMTARANAARNGKPRKPRAPNS